MTDYSAISTLLDLARWRARELKDAPLYTFLRDGEFDEQVCTYVDLDRRAREIGGWLQQRNAMGQRVLLVYPPGIECIAAFFGCIYAGATAVPAYPPRKNRQAERICRMAKDAEASFALTTADLLEQMRPAIAVEPSLADLPWQASDEIGTEWATSWSEPEIKADSLAFLQYTSGSTGAPKGVMVSHGNILHNQQLIHDAFRHEAPTVIGWLPLHHDMGLVGNVLHPLFMGGRLVLLSPVDFLQKPVRWLHAISHYRGAISGGPNFAYELCLEIPASQLEGLDLSCWNVAFNGAEPVRPATMADFSARFAPYGFSPRAFCPCFGMAETTLLLSSAVRGEPLISTSVDAAALENGHVVPVTENIADRQSEAPGRKVAELAACGIPDPSMDTRIVDPESHVECAADRIGEVWVSGASVAQGYWKQPDETELNFGARIRIPSNGSTGYSPRRYLRTGDLGFRYQGQLYVTGRLKDLIIFCGANHYPQDIERTATDSHESLTPGAAAAFSVEEHGREQVVVVQEVKRTYIRTLDTAEVFAKIRAAVVAEHQIPLRSIVLLRPGAIPKTTSGKIQRREARRLFQHDEFNIVARWDEHADVSALHLPPFEQQAGVKPSDSCALRGDSLGSATDDERTRVRALEDWIRTRLSQRLGVPRESLDTRLPLAQLGVDSLNAVRLSGELSDLLGKPLSPTLAYEFPTIAALCAFLVNGRPASAPVEMHSRSALEEPLAIIGIGGRFPGGPDVASFWRLLREGGDATAAYPVQRWSQDWKRTPQSSEEDDETRCPRGGFLDEVDQFDPGFFGINPREADEMDPQQRLLLEVAWETCEDAGRPMDALAGSRTGVFFGLSSCDYLRLQAAAGHDINGYTATGNALAVASNRLSYTFDLRGPSMTIDTACSSSLVAVHQACSSLRLHQCDLALAGGVNLILSPDATSAFGQAGMLSATGVCRAFADGADGFVRAEGCGAVLLKRLNQAIAEGDRIYAVVRGTAVNQDGRSNGLTAPSTHAQQAVMRAALVDAHLSPDDVDYVEAHGTGTELGDPIEMQSLQSVFATQTRGSGPLRVGSVKTIIGHLEAAAGIAGLIKVCLALQHESVPPSLHFDRPSPHIDWTLPVVVNDQLHPWPAQRRPRIAGVSSFGFGGTNAHVIVSEPPRQDVPQPQDPPSPSVRVLALSAKSTAALRQRALDLSRTALSTSLADLCFTANVGRVHLNHRLALRAASTEEAVEKLSAFAQKGKASRLITGEVDHDSFSQWLFTGQGGTHVGAGRWLYEACAAFRQELDACAAALARYWPRPLKTILWDDEQWWRCVDVQPALFCLQVALARLWQSWGDPPRAVLGHSVGEYAAACVAGVFSLDDALKLVTRRAQLFRELPCAGRMLAVMAGEDVVRSCLEHIDPHGRSVGLACINGPQQVVIAGDEQYLAEANKQLLAQGVQTRPLVTTHAFHSPLVEPLLDEFTAVAQQLDYAPPRIPYVSSLLGDFVRDEVATPHYWRRHLRESVRFYQASSKLVSDKALTIEIGVGSTLSTLFRISHPELDLAVLPGLTGKPDEWDSLLTSLARQYLRGARINWRAVCADEGRIISLPTYPFERKRHWFHSPSGQRPPHEASADDTMVHPLLGTRLDLGVTEIVFETDLGRCKYLSDHVINGSCVFPAAGYLELAIAAGDKEGLKRHEVCDLSIERPLVWQPAESCRVQVVLTPVEHGFDGRLMRQDAGRWQRCARFRLEPDVGQPPERVTDEMRGAAVEVAELYRRGRDAGLAYGPAFQGLRRLFANGDEAWGEIELRADLDPSGYLIHPALLDAGLQVASGLLDDPLWPQVWLPSGVKSYRVLEQPAAGTLRVRARRSVQSEDQDFCVDIQLVDASGCVMAEVVQLTLKPGSPITSSNMEYSERWLPKIRPAEPWPTIPGLSPTRFSHDVLQQRPHIMHRTGIAAHVLLLEALEPLAVAWVVKAMQDLGCDFRPGTTIHDRDLAKRLGISQNHERLFCRMLQMLTEVGCLARKGNHDWQVVRAPWREDPDVMSDRLVEKYPAGRTEVTLLRRCGSQLAQVLKGEIDPLPLLFPRNGEISAADLYRDTVGGQTLNALVAEGVGVAVDELAEGRGLRVLEIGAGTGATTESVLAKLPQQRSHYVFSDIAAGFLAQAKTRFRAYENVEYRLLDIERDPMSQGFSPQSFDLVIAANVLHATSDVKTSLTHVRQLLTPGGGLLLVEGTRPVRWLDLTFGLTSGWWRFQDVELRGEYPLLSAEAWHAQLAELGFDHPSFIHPYDSSDPARDPENSLIFSRRAPSHGGVTTAPPAGRKANWIILSDNTGVGDLVVKELAGSGESCAVAFAQTGSNGHRPPGSATLARGELRGWLERAVAAAAPREIVLLWPLDGTSESDLPPQQAMGLSQLLLEFINAVSDVCGDQMSDREHGVRVWLVTRGGQPAAADAAQTGLAQAALWGVMRTLAVELPHWAIKVIDLDPLTTVDKAAAALWDELMAMPRDEEREVAFRNGRRLVRRLMPHENREVTLNADPNETSVLTVTSRGTLEGLRWMRRPRRHPGRGEIEIDVQASGLNFRDVLNTLGVYPGAPPLGAECAGVVTRIGEPCGELKIGDRVLAVAPDSICSVITVPFQSAVKIPDGLSFEQAATLPIAFLTASLALEDRGDIGCGERVLIHSAAGGVGLAAIQLAHDAGAEVFATASLSKHETLRDLGIEHVFDSRRMGFADQILEATNGVGVHLVLNSLPEIFLPENLRVLAPSGRYLDLAKSDRDTLRRVRKIRPDVVYDQIDVACWLQSHAELLRPKLERILRRCHKGRLHALPHQCFRRTEAERAFRLMQSGTSIGKIVITADGLPTSEAAIRQRPESSLPLFRRDACYLITGGLGGLGLLTAGWMAEHGAGQIALMARRDPTAIEQIQIDGIRARGGDVHVWKANVADQRQLDAALGSLRATGRPLAGVFHLAGVLDDALLTSQSPEKFANVLTPKVLGAWNLHRATLADPLDYFVCFSSAASLLGSPGQANHAAANAFLDMLAHHRRSLGLAGLSINWGPWTDIGAAAHRVKNQDQIGGVGFLSPAEGLAFLTRQLQHGADTAQVAAVRLDVKSITARLGSLPLFESLAGRSDHPAGDGPADTRFLDEFQAAPPAERQGLMLAQLRQLVAHTLGFEDPESVPTGEALFDLGLDSLTSLELRNRLEARLGVKVPATLIFDYPTLTRLAEHFTVALNASRAAATPSTPPAAGKGSVSETPATGRQDLDELMRSIHQLTADLDQWEQRHA